jgi:hypothetical protein
MACPTYVLYANGRALGISRVVVTMRLRKREQVYIEGAMGRSSRQDVLYPSARIASNVKMIFFLFLKRENKFSVGCD